MIWGCMLWKGVGYFCKIDGRMDGDLQSTLAFYNKTPCAIIFQQDYDPKHTFKKAQNWFQDHDMEILL